MLSTFVVRNPVEEQLPYPGTDPFFSSTSLLIHGDETPFTDVKGHTITSVGASRGTGFFPKDYAPYSGAVQFGV